MAKPSIDGRGSVAPTTGASKLKDPLGDATGAPALSSMSIPPQVVIDPAALPSFRCFTCPVQILPGKKILHPGLWYLDAKDDGKGGFEFVPTWLCAPLEVVALSCDADESNFGRVLRFQTAIQTTREWAMPMPLLVGRADELRSSLLESGLVIDPDRFKLVQRYISLHTPNRRVECTNAVGWCGDRYVLPFRVFGPNPDGVIFQGRSDTADGYGSQGTLDEWKNEISCLAIDNPLLMLAISAAFAGPLLHPCNLESGGVHYTGPSGTGKSTLEKVCVSVWGSDDIRRSWRATSNGLEGVAVMHNDGLLALDEISECDPREVGKTVYMLANQQGKQRASRTGAPQAVRRWRVMVVSNGERSIGSTMAEGGHSIKAGQVVRLLDIPVNSQYGAFDSLHQFTNSRELADHLQDACKKFHGVAAVEFIGRLTQGDNDHAGAFAALRQHECFNTAGLTDQEKRAAARFAMIAYAGELATSYGITGWTEGQALSAAADCFQRWLDNKDPGRIEQQQIFAAISGFIERHGASRFTPKADLDTIVRDRAGWIIEGPTGQAIYCFHSAGLHDALAGFDFKPALSILEAAGVIERASGSRFVHRISVGDEKPWVYKIDYDQLQEQMA